MWRCRETEPIGCSSGALLLSADHLHSPAYLHLHGPAAHPHQHSPTVTEQTIHLFRQVSCISGADHLHSRAAMLSSPTPMKGRFQLRHLVFFLHRQLTSVISVSGRCHSRTSHWKGAVTLIPTCLCQMLILNSRLFFHVQPRTLYKIPIVSVKSLFVLLCALMSVKPLLVCAGHGSALHRITAASSLASARYDGSWIEPSSHRMYSLLAPSIVEGGLAVRIQAADHPYSREVSSELTVRVRQQCSRKPAPSDCLALYGTKNRSEQVNLPRLLPRLITGMRCHLDLISPRNFLIHGRSLRICSAVDLFV